MVIAKGCGAWSTYPLVLGENIMERRVLGEAHRAQWNVADSQSPSRKNRREECETSCSLKVYTMLNYGTLQREHDKHHAGKYTVSQHVWNYFAWRRNGRWSMATTEGLRTWNTFASRVGTAGNAGCWG